MCIWTYFVIMIRIQFIIKIVLFWDFPIFWWEEAAGVSIGYSRVRSGGISAAPTYQPTMLVHHHHQLSSRRILGLVLIKLVLARMLHKATLQWHLDLENETSPHRRTVHRHNVLASVVVVCCALTSALPPSTSPLFSILFIILFCFSICRRPSRAEDWC